MNIPAPVSRRSFFNVLAGGISAAAARAAVKPGSRDKPSISCQESPWVRDTRLRGQPYNLDAAAAGAAAAGLQYFEPIVRSLAQVSETGEILARHGLAMRSLYVEVTLHDPAEAAESAQQALAMAEAAKRFGAKIILTRPRSIPSPREVPKTDEQLSFQGAQLDRLGAEMRVRGLLLAWPNHDVEILHSAREFHHMMTATDPKNVTLCLDTHWVYRGSGNSQLVLFDLISLHGARISVLHLRQSKNGVWTESVQDGDIDHRRLRDRLRELGRRPLHLVIDQATEKGTPSTMSIIEAHRQGREYLEKLFAD